MARTLDVVTLEGAADHYAAFFMLDNRRNAANTRFLAGPQYVMENLFNATFKDEHETLAKMVRERLWSKRQEEFDRLAGNVFKPRDEAVFHGLLAEKLAIDPDGAHIPGKRGTTIVGGRRVGRTRVVVKSPTSLRIRKWLMSRGLDVEDFEHEMVEVTAKVDWPIYAGEAEERIRITRGERPWNADEKNESSIDSLPLRDYFMAANPTISNAAAIAAADGVVDLLDEGSDGGILVGYTTAQPTNPDVAISGQTKLFTLELGDPAFGAAADAGPGGRATANSITGDSSADATGTLAFLRASSSNDGAAALNDHIDGSAGTSDADFVFNTLSIVSGAAVEMSSWTFTMRETNA